MLLLILGMNYAPELTGIAPFTTGLAEHLAERGHRVTVATTFPHYPQWAFQTPYERRWHAVEDRHGVEVRRSRVLIPQRGRAVSRIAYDTSLAVGAFGNALPLRRPDGILCVSPPVQLGLAAAVLARRWRVPLTLLLQDLPLDAALAVGMLATGPAYRLGRRMERLAYAAADSIVVISAGFGANVRRYHGVPDDKLTVIPNWSDTERIRPLPPDPALRRQLGADVGDFLVLHTGNLGEKQGLTNAVLAAEHARPTARVRLAFVGDGSHRPQLQQLATTRGIRNVGFLPLQPAEVFPRLLGAADALLLHQRANVVDSVAPSKLLSYMAAGRPVVAAVHPASEAATVVRAAECGVIVPPEQPEPLAAAIADLAARPAIARTLGANGRRYAEANYAKARVLAQLEAALLTSAAGS